MKRADWVILIVVVVLAALPLLTLLPPAALAAPAANAVVRQNGAIIRSLPLGQDAQVVIDGGAGTNTIEIANGAASITHASCPDGVCMRMGHKSRTGEMLVCLPNNLTVTIEGAPSGIDAVTQ